MARSPRRDGIQDCFHYLGEVGALMFLCRTALPLKASGAELLEWTLHLKAALLQQKERYAVNQDSQESGIPLKELIIKPPQISTWRSANPIQWAEKIDKQPEILNMHVLSVEVHQAAPPGAAPEWQGHMLIVYEPQTDTLISHFLNTKRAAEASSKWVLYVISIAVEKIRETAISRQMNVSAIHITLPDPEHVKEQVAKTYTEAKNLLLKAIPTGKLSIKWKRCNEKHITLQNVLIENAGTRGIEASLTYESSRSFINATIRGAKKFNEMDHTPASWFALNPQKGEKDRRPGWEEEERKRRLEFKLEFKAAHPTEK